MKKFEQEDDWYIERDYQKERERERRERAINKKKTRDQIYNFTLEEDQPHGKTRNR